MMKKILLATLAVFVAWSALDFVIHGLLLGSSYEATASLWRPMEEMKMGLMYLVTLLVSLCFVTIYARLVSPKSMNAAISFGVLFGLATGISMGYGTYSVQPIPYYMALSWFLGTLVETTVAGLLTGLIIKDGQPAAAKE